MQFEIYCLQITNCKNCQDRLGWLVGVVSAGKQFILSVRNQSVEFACTILAPMRTRHQDAPGMRKGFFEFTQFTAGIGETGSLWMKRNALLPGRKKHRCNRLLLLGFNEVRGNPHSEYLRQVNSDPHHLPVGCQESSGNVRNQNLTVGTALWVSVRLSSPGCLPL